MLSGITFSIAAADRERLEAVIKDRNAPLKYVFWSRFVILSADGVVKKLIMRETGEARTCVLRWQKRLMQGEDIETW